jgi:thiol-disulfide isomerase/thioredoxin
MRLPVRSVFLTLSLVVLFTGFAVAEQGRTSKRVNRAAKPVAAVTEIDTQGLLRLLQRDAPRPLLVNFWATWCDPCREEFPDLVRIDETYRTKGLDFIAISLDDLKDIKTEVPKFLHSMKAEMPAYLLNVPDPSVAIEAVDPQWSGALPATFLYDKQGKVIYKHVGRFSAAELRAKIEAELGKNESLSRVPSSKK